MFHVAAATVQYGKCAGLVHLAVFSRCHRSISLNPAPLPPPASCRPGILGQAVADQFVQFGEFGVGQAFEFFACGGIFLGAWRVEGLAGKSLPPCRRRSGLSRKFGIGLSDRSDGRLLVGEAVVGLDAATAAVYGLEFARAVDGERADVAAHG